MKKILSLLVLLGMTMALTGSSNLLAAQSSAPKAETQSHMSAALNHLQQAEKELDAASHDKGGHRAKAVTLVKQAMSEVQQGIQYDNTHQEKGEPKGK